MSFTSKNTVYYNEDEILVVAFADSKDPDPKQYLILQKDLSDDEPYSYEVNSQAFSNEGGIARVEVYDTTLELYFAESEALYKLGIPSLTINHKVDTKLKELLLKVFEKSEVIIAT